MSFLDEIPFNFLGIPDIDERDADVTILPVPYEKTTSYGPGTKNGPKAIIEASRQIEYYDEELKVELPELVKIKTVKPETGDLEEVGDRAEKYLGKFLISLGGEHTITSALVKPLISKYRNLSVLQIDAHSDMRDEWEGTKWSHACAMRRVQEQGIGRIVQVGIRNTDKSELQYMNLENVFWGNKFDTSEVVERLTDNVYLTFDVDGLDLSIMPATGTPAPGGLSYEQALDLMKAVAKRKNIVGADFVELAPIKGFHGYDFLVAKLIYKLIGYKYGSREIKEF